MIRRAWAIAAGCAAVALSAFLLGEYAPAGPLATAIAGVRPSYGPTAVAAVPNSTAIERLIWVPGLDEGYDPQGLAVAGGAVLVSAYRSDAFGTHRGPCRVFRIGPQSGGETGHLDVPAPCGHAGGLAAMRDGTVYLADTHTLFGFPVGAIADGSAPVFHRLALGPGLVGALAASAPDAIWIGTYSEEGPGRFYRFAAATLAALPDGGMLTVSDASAQQSIPSYAQGAAIDRDGGLWISRSDSRWGELVRIDPASSGAPRRFAAPPGIEGIAFDATGHLWAVSEAGARHFYDNVFARLVTPFFPLVFRLDPARLE
ncbi:MAG TPA: hypothetical protein VHW90_10315 [Stellaceae bacterium]|jgi:hypothetical protein|nr:hypothetical protein [Stellaceae bacterium]